jgi:hypothetical protein
MKRSPMKRGTKPLKRTPFKNHGGKLKPGKRLGPGRKSKQWSAKRAALKVVFAEVEITTCEICPVLPYDPDRPCKRDDWLGFAHAKKRRKLGPDRYIAVEVRVPSKELSHAVLACANGHDRTEPPAITPEQQTALIYSIINNRERAVRILAEDVE